MVRNWMREQQAVGNADAHHEVRSGLPFAARAADDSGAVALRVDAPGTEVGPEPLRRDGSVNPLRANARISSRRSQEFFSRLSRSTFCALVSLISAIGPVFSGAKPLQKQKAHML